MNIWIVNHYAVTASSYGGTRHYSLARELGRLGHRVTVIAADFHHNAGARLGKDEAPGVSVSAAGVTFCWIPVPSYIGNGAARIRNMLSFALSVLRRKGLANAGVPDVIVGSSPHPFAALSAQRLAAKFGVPFVLEVRDLWPDSLVKVAGVSPRHPFVLLLGLIERFLYSRAASIITLLPNSSDHISSKGGDRESIVWIPNGVDFTLSPAPEPKPASGRAVVMYAGTHGTANALESLLDAAKLLSGDDNPPVEFRFVGEGPARAALVARAAEYGLSNVSFTGAVPKAQVFSVLQEADLLVATTRNSDLYSHGLSFNKLFDYLASGRPVVFGANSPGNPIERSGAGIIVPPEDSEAIAAAVRKIIRMEPAERWRLGCRGRRFAEEHYSMNMLAKRMETAILAAKSRFHKSRGAEQPRRM